MEVVIKRIDERKYDEFCEKVMKCYENTGSVELIRDEIETYAKVVKHNKECVVINVDIEGYKTIVDTSKSQNEKNALMSSKIYNEFKKVPANIMLDKYVWVYLSIKVFYEIIMKHNVWYRLNVGLKNPGTEKVDSEMRSMIQRYFLSKCPKTKISRSGMRWLWYVAYKLEGEVDYMLYTFQKIDPIRAVLERNMADDPMVLRAYIMCIKRLFDEREKHLDHNQRTKVPTHIYCYGAVNRFEVYDEKELTNVMYEQAKYILD